MADFVSPNERHVINRVFGFACVLRAAGLMPPDEDEYFERPWKWGREYVAWQEAGKPEIPDPASDTTDLAWERFVRAVGALT